MISLRSIQDFILEWTGEFDMDEITRLIPDLGMEKTKSKLVPGYYWAREVPGLATEEWSEVVLIDSNDLIWRCGLDVPLDPESMEIICRVTFPSDL